MKRAFKIAAVSVGVLVLGGGVFASTWPTWLSGYAEGKMDRVLSSKFETVEHGGFELTKTQVTVKDLRLSNEDASIKIDELVVGFSPDWWGQKAIINNVALLGGSSEGTLEGFKSLRSSDDSSKPPSSGRIDTSNASINVKDLALKLSDRGYVAQGTITASADTIKGPFDVRLSQSALLQKEVVLVSAEAVTTKLDREKPWPLVLTLSGVASSALEDVVIRDVTGIATVRDSGLTLVSANLKGRTDGGQTWSFEGWVDRENEEAQGHLIAKGLTPEQLPISDLPLDPNHGTLSVDLELNRTQDLVTAKGKASVKDLRLHHKKLARDPVVLGADLELDAEAFLGKREILVNSLTVQPRIGDRLSTVKVQAKGRVGYADDPASREYELEMHMDPNPCQEVLESMPPGLFPALKDFELGGDASVDFKLVVHMAAPDETVLEGGLELKHCKLKKVPDTVESLGGSFMHLVRMRNGQILQRPLMRGHAFFAPYDELPGHVGAAVLATEDGGFWSHKGYRMSAFQESLRRNVELGKFRRGGSTLSMQMVKNTLLTHEKTVSRKLQELFLTWAVEKVLSKQRILEIYLNIVEYGPGIYGISHAADHYFGKPASELSSLEAVFLATLLPRPVERHAMWCRNRLTPKHDAYIRKVHARMLRKSGHVTQEEFDQSELDGIVFSRTGFSSEKECLADGARMKSGTHTQGALSGLLGDQ